VPLRVSGIVYFSGENPMPADFRHTVQELFNTFRKTQEGTRQLLDGVNSKRDDFFTKFEEFINGAIGECVEDIRSVAGEDATVEVTSGPNREWYQVTISATTVTGKRNASRRFCANYPSQAVSVQTPDAKGDYSNINGEEGIDTFHERRRVQGHLNRALHDALGIPF
jgi:hypothetical protein